ERVSTAGLTCSAGDVRRNRKRAGRGGEGGAAIATNHDDPDSDARTGRPPDRVGGRTAVAQRPYPGRRGSAAPVPGRASGRRHHPNRLCPVTDSIRSHRPGGAAAGTGGWAGARGVETT